MKLGGEEAVFAVLSREDYLFYCRKSPPLVENMVDPDVQIQSNGIEFTLKEVYKFDQKHGPGAVSFENRKRKVVGMSLIPFDEKGWVKLKRGAYKVVFNEVVHIPSDLFAIARPRSTLLRNGATVETAVWDSGYSGRSESLLVVYNDAGLFLERNARLIQLVFFKISDVTNPYEGRYQGENLAEQLGLLGQ